MQNDKLCWCPLCPALGCWRNNHSFDFIIHKDICKTGPMTAQGLMSHLRQKRGNIFHFAALTFLEMYYCKDRGNWRGTRKGNKNMYAYGSARYRQADREEVIYRDKELVEHVLRDRQRDILTSPRSNDQGDGQNNTHQSTRRSSPVSNDILMDEGNEAAGAIMSESETRNEHTRVSIDGGEQKNDAGTLESETGILNTTEVLPSHRSNNQSDSLHLPLSSTVGPCHVTDSATTDNDNVVNSVTMITCDSLEV